MPNPDMAEKELWVYLLTYNLIRLLIAQAALLSDQVPRQLSFRHTVQVWFSWQQCSGPKRDAATIEAMGRPEQCGESRVGILASYDSVRTNSIGRSRQGVKIFNIGSAVVTEAGCRPTVEPENSD